MIPFPYDNIRNVGYLNLYLTGYLINMKLFVGFLTMTRARFHLVIKLDSIEEFKAHDDYSTGIFPSCNCSYKTSVKFQSCVYNVQLLRVI